MTLEPAWPVLFTFLGIVEIARMWGYRIPRRRAAADICVALLFLDGLIIGQLIRLALSAQEPIGETVH